MDELKGKWAKERKTVGNRTSRVERGQLLRKYRASGQTQESFAARMGINVGTLRGWIYKQRPPATADHGPLAPVRIVDDARAAKITTRGAITVRWPQGIEVEVAVELDNAGALRLVRELLAPCLR
jgi:hypothetical protein